MPVNGLDVAVFALVAVCGAIGAWRGFLREFMSLAAWVLAIAGAWLLTDLVAARLVPTYDLAFAKIAGAVMVFIAVFIIVMIAGFVLRRMLFSGRPGAFGRVAGGLLGAARGGAVVLIMVLLAGLFSSLSQKPLWRESYSMPYFQTIAHKLKSLFPPEVAREFRYG
jgi:membrane protein required for colicin V production